METFFVFQNCCYMRLYHINLVFSWILTVIFLCFIFVGSPLSQCWYCWVYCWYCFWRILFYGDEHPPPGDWRTPSHFFSLFYVYILLNVEDTCRLSIQLLRWLSVKILWSGKYVLLMGNLFQSVNHRCPCWVRFLLSGSFNFIISMWCMYVMFCSWFWTIYAELEFRYLSDLRLNWVEAMWFFMLGFL